jgi:hypothetical protein
VTGTLKLQRHTMEAIAKQFKESDAADEIACCIAGWRNEDQNGPYLSVESLRAKVSVAGKRNFEGGDKEAETASKVRERRYRDKI